MTIHRPIRGKCLSICRIFCLIAAALLINSCNKEFSCEGCRETNRPPIANAGRDTVIVLPVDSIKLDGSGSTDSDGIIAEFLWEKISGPSSLTIINASDSTTMVKALVAGTYQFELKVTDNGGLSAKDTIRVTVDSVPTANHPPVADAGADEVIFLPTNSVSLDGSGSTDSDNNIISYIWTKISGPSSSTIVNANIVQTQVQNLVEGVYQFEVKVTDAGGLSAKDTIQVLVNIRNDASCPFQKTIIGTIYPYRYAFKTATAGNKIVFAGGFEVDVNVGSVPSTRVNIFDMVTQTWSSADLTHGGHMGVIGVGDKIFLAGGAAANGGSSGIASSRVDIYNTTNNTWTNAELSEARSGISTVRAGDKILFAGGGSSTKVDIYDLTSSSWSVADIQHPIYGATALGNKAVLEASALFDVYDAPANTWSVYPTGEYYYNMSKASSENKIYLAGGYAGGYGGNQFTDLVHVYDVFSNSWSSVAMSQPKTAMTSIGAGDKIFWAGGFDSTWVSGTEDQIRPVNDVEIYDVVTGAYSHHNMIWNGIYGGYAATNNHVVFRSVLDAWHVYNLNSQTWSICTMDLGWSPEAISVGNVIYVAGPQGFQPGGLTVWKLEF